MRRICILLMAVLVVPHFLSVSAQEVEDVLHYRRSSLYSFMISHPEQEMDDEIVSAFMAIETPDKYNNHDLSVKCVTGNSRQADFRNETDAFLERNQVAKRLVSKWFLRNKETGGFESSLVLERGLYGVTVQDIETALMGKRGVSALADKGYELISNTFVIVNDITYADHEANADAASGILDLIGGLAAVVTGDEDNLVTSLTSLGSAVSGMISGFAVNINTHLYQLDWNDEVAAFFYERYYYDKPDSDTLSARQQARKAAFEADDSTFRMRYVGSYKARSDKPVLRGLYSPEDVFRKVLARAIDKNIVALQREFGQFKVKVPVTAVDGKTLTAAIGMKEGVTAQSRYEVLMPVLDERTGKVSYNRKGVVRPEARQIWDNRYMAVEEQAVGSEFNATTFRIISDFGIRQGMLLREIK